MEGKEKQEWDDMGGEKTAKKNDRGMGRERRKSWKFVRKGKSEGKKRMTMEEREEKGMVRGGKRRASVGKGS